MDLNPSSIGTPLRPGEIVRVRSEPEILATLDGEGALEGLPFMPEMLPYCGGVLRVFKRADKTCNSIHSPGMFRMKDAVFLWGARCDGSAHGGCQAACLFFWKEAWLSRRLTDVPEDPGGTDLGAPGPVEYAGGCTVDAIRQATMGRSEPGAEIYACQATQLGAATARLPDRPWWDLRQYVGDVRSGNTQARHVALVLSRRAVASVRFRLGRLLGRLGATTGDPTALVDESESYPAPTAPAIQPGDRVLVRTKREIQATLDATGRSKGLSFYSEMESYCGGEFRVLRRVERIIREDTGRMITLRDCLVLDDVVCGGDDHRFCPRAVYPYWREAWLRRLG